MSVARAGGQSRHSRLTMKDVAVDHFGRLAAQLLFARLDGDDSPPRKHVVPTGIVVRGSGEIRPVPTAASSG